MGKYTQILEQMREMQSRLCASGIENISSRIHGATAYFSPPTENAGIQYHTNPGGTTLFLFVLQELLASFTPGQGRCLPAFVDEEESRCRREGECCPHSCTRLRRGTNRLCVQTTTHMRGVFGKESGVWCFGRKQKGVRVWVAAVV
jgi:hypothetical protein